MGLVDQDRDDVYGTGEAFAKVVEQRISRRGVLRAGIAVTALAIAGPAVSLATARRAAAAGPMVSFTPIGPHTGDQIVVPAGYRYQVVHRWGDPLFARSPEFDLARQSADAQELQVGFNHDFTYFLPLGRAGAAGLLWTNHEYTDGAMMFPAYDPAAPTEDQVLIELAAHGATLVRVDRISDAWVIDRGSPYNRRITGTTPIRISGPAAGIDLLRTDSDPSGRRVLGMLNNCGGGVTPWGTVLTCEENFNQYFANAGALPAADPRSASHRRYGIPSGASERRWEAHVERFDVARHPNEPFRFGWVVEVDPLAPGSIPVKRTALGRFKHEAATCVKARDGRVVVYSGDDERFDYVYKFVSDRPVSDDRARNADLLDTGTLYTARFLADGTGTWLPLRFGTPPLDREHGFASQGEVLARTREAADALGATKMDRPEDFEANPVTGKVYGALTNNTQRGTTGRPGTDAANPRARNRWGHILEIAEAGADMAATSFTWEIFLLAGDPADPSTFFAGFPKDQVSPMANPDNITFDSRGNLWIATDGQPNSLGLNDGIYAVPTEGPQRGQVLQLLGAVVGAEVASLGFTPDSKVLFAAIQHPGEGGTLAAPTSHWPDGSAAVPRPAVIAVWREDGAMLAG